MARLGIEVASIMALSGLTACGPSGGEPVEVLHVATCGSDGPVRLLPDALVLGVMQHGERLVAVGLASFGLAADDASGTRTFWSVGSCGEDPVTLHEGPGEVGVVGDLLLLCDDDGGVHRLDPTGARPPELLLQGVSCHLEATPAGLLAHDPVHRAVRLHPSPHEDGVAAITVAEGVPDPALDCDPGEPDCDVYGGGVPPYPFQVDGSSLFVLDAEARLSRIELPALARDVLAEDVHAFVVLPGTERVLTEDVEIVQHGGQGRGRVRLVDLTTGQSQPLLAAGLPPKIRWPIAVGHATETLDDVDGRRRFGAFDLRTGARLDMPETSSLTYGGPSLGHEEHFVLEADGSTYHRWSDAAGGWIELGRFATCSTAFQHHGRLEVTTYDCEGGGARELWLADFDGGGPVLAASGLSNAWLTREDHVVWSDEPMAESIDGLFGNLWVAELFEEHRWRLDDRALLLAASSSDPDLDGDVLYVVHDGERSGLWRSALPK